MQFPRMMYKKGPGLNLPRGQSVTCKGVFDEKAYEAALDAGWYPSVPEALAESLAKVDAPNVEPPKAPSLRLRK